MQLEILDLLYLSSVPQQIQSLAPQYLRIKNLQSFDLFGFSDYDVLFTQFRPNC